MGLPDMTRVFGARSKGNLASVHPRLVAVATRALALSTVDFTVIEGHRGREAQEDAYRRGASKARFPQSAHNQQPSCAIDVIPYPFKGWTDHYGWREIAKAFFAAAAAEKIVIRWGGNWSTKSVEDKGTGFVDMPHFELHPWKDWAANLTV